MKTREYGTSKAKVNQRTRCTVCEKTIFEMPGLWVVTIESYGLDKKMPMVRSSVPLCSFCVAVDQFEMSVLALADMAKTPADNSKIKHPIYEGNQ